MKTVILFLLCALPLVLRAQDELHCSNNPARAWWDVQEYDLGVTFDTASDFIYGSNRIRAKVVHTPVDSLQIDLAQTLKLDSVYYEGRPVAVQRYDDRYYLKERFSILAPGKDIELQLFYSGRIKEAARAPWDGGLVRTRDGAGKPWMAIACQGEGASIWFPCKNFQGDEPEKVIMRYTAPEGLTAVGNGRLMDQALSGDRKTRTWIWRVQNPINNYDITFYIGDYAHWSEEMDGVGGTLSLDYYVLTENVEKAKKQFEVVKPMLRCFEEKIGAYPFYEDGYKLVDAPYLGMEHQSAVAYGNGYRMGYKGEDRSRTGAGLDFDFIIIHESGHEWFGNSITAFDKADTWIQEGFTSYTETIFEECLAGRDRAFLYQKGTRNTIRNDRPVQGRFNACDEGSADHYNKAAFMIHMIRMIMDDDTRFFSMLRDMNRKFFHRIVTGKDVEAFISTYSGKDFSKVFDQYLRQAQLPKLELRKKKNGFRYRWTGCTPGFDMPVRVYNGTEAIWLQPSAAWRQWEGRVHTLKVDENFLVE